MDKLKTLIITSLISTGLLILFSTLHILNPKLLSLDTKWLFVSGIPILIGLFLSGVIKSFKGFGVELETNLSEKIELELVGSVENFPTPEITKQSIHFLHEMSTKQKTKIKRLQFINGKKNYYNSSVIKEYLDKLKYLRYIEIIDEEGRFMGLIPASKFKMEERDIENIELLINGIERGNIPDSFKDFIADTIKNTDSLIDAFKKFNKSSHGKIIYGEQILPVINSSDKMIGITKKSKLTEKIAEQVLKSEK